ncbi:MAG: DUF401 family protein [Thermodesulfobacteriota bacterium]
MDLNPLAPLLKIASVFLLIVFLLRRSFQVGPALALGACALGILFGMGPRGLFEVFWTSTTDTRSLLLMAVVSLIMILSSSMERVGLMEDLLRSVRKSFAGRPWGMVLLPALIGLLPMPGGAYFSAPMLDGFDPARRISPALKSFLNYWFRHIWEYWWPLFPAVLLTCTVADLEMWRYSISSFPITLAAVGAGLPLLARLPDDLVQSAGEPSSQRPEGSLWNGFLPILIAIVPGVFLSPLADWAGCGTLLGALPRESGILVGLGAAVLWIWTRGGLRWRDLGAVAMDPKMPRMWLTVAGVLIFKGAMEYSGAALQVSHSLIGLKVPLAGVAVLLPLIVGLISGLPIAFVGTCVPILLSMLEAMGLIHMKLAWVILSFVSGFVGSLLAPTHLCLILSNEYFGAPWGAVYRHLWLPALLLLVGGISHFLLLEHILQ